MNHKNQSDKQSMTSLQRQAVLVCVVCALAALLTVGITLTLLKRGKPETPGHTRRLRADGHHRGR